MIKYELVCLAVCVACTQENHMLDNQVDHVQPQHAIRQQWPTGKHVVEETCTALLWESNPTQQRHELQVHARCVHDICRSSDQLHVRGHAGQLSRRQTGAGFFALTTMSFPWFPS